MTQGTGQVNILMLVNADYYPLNANYVVMQAKCLYSVQYVWDSLFCILMASQDEVSKL